MTQVIRMLDFRVSGATQGSIQNVPNHTSTNSPSQQPNEVTRVMINDIYIPSIRGDLTLSRFEFTLYKKTASNSTGIPIASLALKRTGIYLSQAAKYPFGDCRMTSFIAGSDPGTINNSNDHMQTATPANQKMILGGQMYGYNVSVDNEYEYEYSTNVSVPTQFYTKTGDTLAYKYTGFNNINNIVNNIAIDFSFVCIGEY